MSYPTQITKLLAILLLLLLFFLSSSLAVHAASQVTLTGMKKLEQIDHTQITFLFTELPSFAVEHSGQRVDLLLKEVVVSATLRSLPEDQAVVKIMLAQKYRDLLLSLLLRRAPTEVITESKNDPPRVILDLYWEGEKNTRTGIAFRIADMPVRKASKRAMALKGESPWTGRWPAFFKDYQTAWDLTLPLHYSLPPLAALIVDMDSPLWPLQQFAQEQQWLSLIRRSSQIQGLDPEQGYLLRLLVAEAEIRSGSLEAGLARLELLQELAGPEQFRVDYLTAYALAINDQPYVAQLALQELLPTLSATEPLTVFVTLLAAETAIASKQYPLALKYLENAELVWPAELLAVVALRSADARAGLGQLQAAVDSYQDLWSEPGLFERYPSSCNRAAFAAYQAKMFDFSARLYRQLGGVVKEAPGRDLIQFAAGAAAYNSGDLKWGGIGLQKARLDWPGTEGAERAELRLVDHQLLTGGELGMAEAASDYAQLGQKASNRMVREEATFKRALALYLLADHRESVKELMSFQRSFGSTELRRETDLLLLAQLPTVIHDLLQQQRDLEAVVLVEQNRKLLLRGEIKREFLDELAAAFDNLGLYARAGRVLLYLFDQASSEELRKSLYLPLARSFLKRNEYRQASGYADTYLKKYPRGTDSGALFGVLLDAFEKQERSEEMIAWLGRKNRPSSPALEVRAAWIYWQQQRPNDVVKSLEKARAAGGELQVKEMALLAESYYLLAKNSAAEKIYRQLESEAGFSSQARYRRAQILLRKQDQQGALNLLAQLVDEDAGSSWGKLAQDLLIQEK